MSNFALPMELPNFHAALKDVNSSFAPSRLAAVVALSLAQEEQFDEAIRTLVPLLQDPLEEVLVHVVDALASLAERGGRVPQQDILSLLNTESINVRSVVLEQLHLFVASPLSYAITAAADDEEAIRIAAVSLLGQIDDEKAYQRLQELVEDASVDVSHLAALQLPPAYITTASRHLLNEAVRLKTELALDALVLLANSDIEKGSVKTTHDLALQRFTPFDLKCFAASALLAWEEAQGESLVKQFLNSWRKSRRLMMVQALSQARGESVVRVLCDFVVHAKSEEEGSAGIQALFQIAAKDTTYQQLINSLTSSVREPLRGELDDMLEQLEDAGNE